MALDSELILNLPETERMAEVDAEVALRGSVLVLIQLDVCEGAEERRVGKEGRWGWARDS